MLNRSTFLASALALCLMLLTACGGDSSTDEAPAPTAEPSPTASPRLTSEAWATQVCGAATSYSTTISTGLAAVPGDVNTMTLDERKRRSLSLTSLYVSSMQNFITTLDKINPPQDAEAFHKALTNQVKSLKAEIERAKPLAETATSLATLDDLNTQFAAVQSRAQTDANAAASTLSSASIGALNAIPTCGALGR